jgi:hypothetical protein
MTPMFARREAIYVLTIVVDSTMALSCAREMIETKGVISIIYHMVLMTATCSIASHMTPCEKTLLPKNAVAGYISCIH